MTKLAPEWVRTSDPVIRSPARYRWTTAPAHDHVLTMMYVTMDNVLSEMCVSFDDVRSKMLCIYLLAMY